MAGGGDRQTVTIIDDLPLLQSQTGNVQSNIRGATVIAMPLNVPAEFGRFNGGGGNVATRAETHAPRPLEP